MQCDPMGLIVCSMIIFAFGFILGANRNYEDEDDDFDDDLDDDVCQCQIYGARKERIKNIN